MDQILTSSVVMKVGPGSLLFDMHRCFLTPGDTVYACAIRVANGCCFIRTLIRPYVPEIGELTHNFNTCPGGWKWAGVGNPEL